MLLPTSVYIICLLFGAWVIHAAWSWHRLRHIPGSIWISHSKLWQVRAQMSGKWYLELRKVGNRYGDLFRIGPNQVMTTDVGAIRRMAHPKSRYTRSPFYRTFRFSPAQDHTFSLLDEREHRRRRTVLAPGYASGPHVEACVDRQCAALVDLIERQFISTPREHRPLDLTATSLFFAMDCVGDLAYGRPFGCLDLGRDVHGFIRWNEAFFNVAIVVANFPWLTALLSRLPFGGLYPSALDADGVGKFIGLAQEAFEKSIHNGVDRRRDVTASFIDHGATKREIINELVLQIVAGTDSTAVGIRMTLFLLVSTPAAYLRLRAEIDRATRAGLLSSPVTHAEAQRLPYLQAVIREGLRVFPVVAAPFYKCVPSGGDVIAGHFVPEATEVGVDILGVMRHPRYWGPDPDAFRPERWLEAPPAATDVMATALETLWGAGRYKCLGRAIVQVELNKVFVELLRRFDFAVVNPQDPVKIVNSGFFLMSKLEMRDQNEAIK
ncbi:cytochrome P450 [Durotheca rogersii]|uniref:cytochrome P450 n=1 Tax=Durotheca rogersii TaxID=419775 RepID=UPI0022207FF9|nr:cytochrome P450 [Durotheca rogersii]KAI5866698.1 cytochrome P450 [Durotheca rogersii]